MNRSFDLLGLGITAVDDLLYVDNYPPPESKIRVRRRIRQCGGLTGSAMIAAARLGAQCAYAGRLGEDELSRFVIDAFKKEGVCVDFVRRRPSSSPAYSTIIVDESSKTRTVFSEICEEVGPAVDWPEESLIKNAKTLLIDHHGIPGTLRAVRLGQKHGIPTVADFERDPGEGFAELLPMVEHLIISERFAEELTGEKDAMKAAKKLWSPTRKAVVVTCGQNGAWFLERPQSEASHSPALSVETVDTTGCGDVFHGAYCVALAEGKTTTDCVRFASVTAGLKARSQGATAGCPNRAEVESRM